MELPDVWDFILTLNRLEPSLIEESKVQFSILYYYQQASEAARTVSVDRTGHSVSFNEYLKLVSNERKSEPDEDALLNMFKWEF